jgi:epoxyqueuosine reductase
MSNQTIKEYIKHTLLSGGIDLVGVVKYELLSKQIEKYNQWIDDSLHADMHYMARNIDKREDVRLIMDNTKSIIVTGLNYFSDTKYINNKHKISRYAWGTDYHIILKEKLEKLTEELKLSIYGSEFKVYVDTGPVLEKQWASLSGIGWQGKNSLILNKDFGSWFFLGIILTNLDIESDSPVRDHCGTCNSCISACPTNAIIQPNVVDSRKCISYWTIEAKPNIEIPDEISKKNQNWAFGCDICQEVCPWNKKIRLTNIEEFNPRFNQTEFLEEEINSIDTDKFNLRFKNSPIKRSKLDGIQRNIKSID